MCCLINSSLPGMRALPVPPEASGGCLRVGVYLGGLWQVLGYTGNPVSGIQRCCNCRHYCLLLGLPGVSSTVPKAEGRLRSRSSLGFSPDPAIRVSVHQQLTDLCERQKSGSDLWLGTLNRKPCNLLSHPRFSRVKGSAINYVDSRHKPGFSQAKGHTDHPGAEFESGFYNFFLGQTRVI